MYLCEYGCGQEYHYIFKNGKKCCNNTRNKCNGTKLQIKKTFLEKYGVEHPSQLKEIKEKKKETCLKNYGVENPSQSSKIQKLKNERSLEKYGVENPFQSNEIKEKNKRN